MILPDGVSTDTFAAALAALRAAVGADWVFSSDEDVALYRDAYSPVWDETDERVPSAAVAPDNVAQVQAVMRIANQYRLPIYPISTGKNLGYGGSAPNLRGSVVLDLKRMNKVIEVDDKRHFAIVEPGVSYFDLYRHIQDHGLKVWIDVPGPGWGSPVGNALDHGVGDTVGQYRNHFSSHCGMEVVLPDGELIRTGMGALPGAESWAEYPYGFGPTVDGLFAQGNFGVVTKMGFWLLPEPESYLTGTITVPRRADISGLIDLANYLENLGIGGEPVFASPIGAEQGHAGYQALIAGGKFPSDADLDAFAHARNLPFWSLKLQFYGPKEVVDGQWKAAQRLARERLPGAAFTGERPLTLPLSAADQATVETGHFGIPSLSSFALTARSPRNPAGADGHLFFSPIFPRTGAALLELQRVIWEVLQAENMPAQVGPFTVPNTWIYRSFVCIVVFFISRSDADANKKVRSVFRRLIAETAKHGWGEYRTHAIFQDEVRAQYSFNDHALLKFHERLKDAVDPNGIVAAGRSGIWPAHLRKTS